MVDLQTVCCMCGDVGFSDKLFRCIRCHNRFQHSYCSNYYGKFSEPIELCDWCQSEARSNPKHGHQPSKKPEIRLTNRSEYYSSGAKIKQFDREESSNEKGKGITSPRTAIRRYKLLKDVMY